MTKYDIPKICERCGRSLDVFVGIRGKRTGVSHRWSKEKREWEYKEMILCPSCLNRMNAWMHISNLIFLNLLDPADDDKLDVYLNSVNDKSDVKWYTPPEES